MHLLNFDKDRLICICLIATERIELSVSSISSTTWQGLAFYGVVGADSSPTYFNNDQTDKDDNNYLKLNWHDP